MKRMMILVLILMGCADDAADNETPVNCNDLTRTECEANSECLAFTGLPYKGDETCTQSNEFIVCGPVGEDTCFVNNGVRGTIKGPNGQCWQQSESCFTSAPGYSLDAADGCGPVMCGTEQVE